MTTAKWVCFDCRVEVRRAASDANVRCSSCGLPCVCLGTRTEVPPRSKVKRWKALRELHDRGMSQLQDRWRRWQARQVHALEKQIAEQSVDDQLPGCEERLLRLRARLACLRQQELSPHVAHDTLQEIRKQAARYSSGRYPMPSQQWHWAQAREWLVRQTDSLWLFFEADVVYRMTPTELVAFFDRSDANGSAHDPFALDSGMVIFPKDYIWALFVYPLGMFTWMNGAPGLYW